MAPSTLNILITTFPGLNLAPTISLALPATAPLSSLYAHISSRLPPSSTLTLDSLLLTTLSSRFLPSTASDSTTPISSLTTSPNDDHISLRLSMSLCGGKGGFGSQLRAAGGRMSKRRNKGGQQQDENGSSRNLDGRRLRTITEAKALAEYLAIKPEMDRREKEKRKQRWQEIVDMTERRQDEIRHGKANAGLDGRWVEEKEVAGERLRELVGEVVKTGAYKDNLSALSASVGSTSSSAGGPAEEDDDDDEEESGNEQSGGSKATTPPSEPEQHEIKNKGKAKEKAPARTFFGFDEDDEFMSSDEESEGVKQ